MRFDLAQLTRTAGSSDSATVMLHGSLTLHGVTRSVELPATIRIARRDVHLRSDFPLNLKDYRIGGLSKMLGMLKMYEKIEVHVDLSFRLAEAG